MNIKKNHTYLINNNNYYENLINYNLITYITSRASKNKYIKCFKVQALKINIPLS